MTDKIQDAGLVNPISAATQVALDLKVDTTGGIVTGPITATDFIGPLNGPIRFSAKNTSGGTLTVGQVVYISGVSGNTPTVGLANANDSAKMPAYGLVAVETVDNDPVEIITFGALTGVKTDYAGWALGDTLYVSTTPGTLTNVAPSGESSLIQNLGRIRRLHQAAGSITVGGAGRTNATPNLNDGNVFIGNASNQSVPRALVVADTTGLQTALDGKVDDSQVLTNVPSGAVFTDTTYSVGDGGLSQKNFTTTLKTKLDGIATSANYITNNNQLTNGAGYVTSSGNTIIGTDTDVNTSGATIIDNIYMTDGVIQSHGTRTLTLSDLGYTGETNATADQTAAQILTAIKTVDGPNSNLDADLLDGQHGSYYAPQSTTYTKTQTDTAISNLVAAAPATLDTLNELAAALGDDPNFATTVTNSVALKAPLASPSFTGDIAVTGNVDGRDIAVDGTKLDGIETSANYITNNNQLTNGAGYVTSSGTVAQSHYVSGSAFSTNGPDNVLEYQQASGQTDTKLAPSADWHNSIRMGHGDPYSYYGNTIAVRMTGSGTGDLYTQCISNNNAQGWRKHWSNANDGSGSGLDADLLDGQQGSYYSPTSHTHSYLPLSGGTMTGVLDMGSASASGYRFGGRAFSWNSSMQSPSSYVPHIMQSSYSGWDPVMGLKTTNGFWQMGAYASDSLHIGYMGGAFGSHGSNAFDSSIKINPSELRVGDTGTMNIIASGNVTAYSDARIKSNIEVIPNALDKVKQLSGYTYTRTDIEDKSEKHTGVIAQEVLKVLPEAVHLGSTEEDTMSVAYGNMVGLLIEAIKELNDKVNSLETENTSLKLQLEAVMARLDKAGI